MAVHSSIPRMHRLPVVLAAILPGIVGGATRLAAQPARPAPVDGACSYERCALGIAPRWNGLALVRGTTATPVANLNFFWPRPLDRVLADSDSAAHYGARAVRVRRVAAVLTDGGGALVAYALARRLNAGRLTDDARVAAALGAAGVAVSVPLHFAADGHLSRAVWWHNLRYAR